MTAGLPTLPIEIIGRIAGNLEPTDLFNVRRACRELYGKTLHDFSIANFTTAYIDLTPKSLRRLQAISNSEHLAQYVKILHIQNVGTYWNSNNELWAS
ncbi:hypothetical protein P7C71_g4004, partial [Lecanoromycetidae sp. Uapishka_2]